MNLKPLFITGLSCVAALAANSAVASPFVSSGLAISAFETARTVRESADERMTRAVTDTSRAAGGSIWLDLKAASDEADTMVNNAGFENDLAVVNLGADIRQGEAFFGVVYTYARADTEGRGLSTGKADGEADIFGITAFGQRNFGGLNLALSAGWIYMSGDSDMADIVMRATSYISGDLWESKSSSVLSCAWTYMYTWLSGKVNHCQTGMHHGMGRRKVYPKGLHIVSVPYQKLDEVCLALRQMDWQLISFRPNDKDQDELRRRMRNWNALSKQINESYSFALPENKVQK